jgi:putative membrane protein
LIRTDASFVAEVERAVRDAERGTSAELVVVVAARSGTYRDVAFFAGAVAAASVLFVALFARRVFPPIAVAVEVPLVFALGAWLVHRLPSMIRRLVTAGRMKRQVERAATWWFVEQAVHGTRGRTGVLVYVSSLEEQAAIVADLGLSAAALPRSLQWRSTEDVVAGIASLGALLCATCPGSPSDANELPDAPRIVP